MKRWIALASLLLTCCAPVFGQRVVEIPLTTNHLVYDPVSQRIYATVPSSAGSIGNSVAVINPVTGKVGRTVFVGSEPDAIAVSDDGQFLYAGLDGASLIQRLALPTMEPNLSISVGSGSLGPYYAAAIAVLPGTPHSVAVSQDYQGVDPPNDGLAIFDDGVPRPLRLVRGVNTYDSLAFSSSSSTLYTFGYGGLTIATITADGASAVNAVDGVLGEPLAFDSNDQLLYGGGHSFNPATGTTAGSFSAITTFSDGYYNTLDPIAMAPDSAQHVVYILFAGDINSQLVLAEYSSDTQLPIGSLVIPQQSNTQAHTAGPGDIVLWGAKGLAFHNADGYVATISTRSLPGLKSFKISAPSLVAGSSSVTGTVTLTEPAPAGGLTVNLISTESVTMPNSLAFPQGAIKETFQISAPTFIGSAKALISAVYGVQENTVPLFVSQAANTPEYPANVRVLNLVTQNLTADPVSDTVYASTPSSAGADGNSILAISPTSLGYRSLGYVGSEPDDLALSDDGSFLYVGLNGSGSVARYDFASSAIGLQYSLGLDPLAGTLHAEDMVVMPGLPHSLAVATANVGYSPASEGVRVFDDGTAVPGVVDELDSLAVNPAIPGRLYGYDNEDTSFNFAQMSLTNTGLAQVKSQWNLLSGFGSTIAYDNGMVYCTDGKVIDPENLILLGTFQGLYPGAVVLPDSADGFDYFVTPTSYGGSSPLLLNVYDPATYLQVAAYPLTNIVGAPISLARTGPNHLVLDTDSGEVVFINATPANISGLSLNPTSVTGGQTATATVTISNVAPIAGLTVTLRSTSAAATVPPTVVVPAGEKTVTFTVNTSAVSTATVVTVRATYNKVTHGATLTINP